MSAISLKQRLYVASRLPWRWSARSRLARWIPSERARLESAGVDLGSPAEGPLTVMVVNEGYLDFVGNWLLHYRTVASGRLLAIAVDEAAHQQMAAEGVPVVRCSLVDGADADFAAYGEMSFNRITAHKMMYVFLLLEAGHDVLLTDADTVWLQDPVPLLDVPADLQIQLDTPNTYEVTPELLRDPKVCTGFFLARSNPRTLRFFHRVLELQLRLPRLNDQHCANLALRHGDMGACFRGGSVAACPPEAFSVEILDPLRFANGSIYFDDAGAFDAHGVEPVMVHANWIHGRERKIEHLRRRGHWAL